MAPKDWYPAGGTAQGRVPPVISDAHRRAAGARAPRPRTPSLSAVCCEPRPRRSPPRARPPGLRARHGGVTLFELVVVLAVIAVLISIAVPGMASLRDSQALQGAAWDLLSAVHLARSEAIKRNRNVVLCPSPAGAPAPGCSGVLASGWIVFVDLDASRDHDPGEPLLRRGSALDRNLSLSNRAGTRLADERVSYRPDGSARRNLTWLLCSRRDPGLSSRALVLNRVGRPRLARGWGDCAAAASLPDPG